MARQMQDAYIVAATRTPVGKAPRGAFKHTRPDSLLAHVLKSVLAQVREIEPQRIEDVVVDSSVRGRGAGEALSREALRIAGSLGARTVELTSRSSREAANRLYQRLGFQPRDTNVYRYSAP